MMMVMAVMATVMGRRAMAPTTPKVVQYAARPGAKVWFSSRA